MSGIDPFQWALRGERAAALPGEGGCAGAGVWGLQLCPGRRKGGEEAPAAASAAGRRRSVPALTPVGFGRGWIAGRCAWFQFSLLICLPHVACFCRVTVQTLFLKNKQKKIIKNTQNQNKLLRSWDLELTVKMLHFIDN